jgi:hypothetical protein
MGKNILLLISGAIIIYLLKNKQTATKQVLLASNANLLQKENAGVNKPLAEYKYKTCIYSDNAIKANLIDKKENISKVTLPGIIATDAIKISGIPLVY